MSTKRRHQSGQYLKLRRKFLRAHPLCVRCKEEPSQQVHHTRGRAGRLYLAVEFWAALCPGCHKWIDDNRDRARSEGWLGPWGKQT